jgi:hypothetical protein
MEPYESRRVDQYPSNAARPIITIRIPFERHPQAPDVYANRLVATADTVRHCGIAKVASKRSFLQSRTIEISRTITEQ